MSSQGLKREEAFIRRLSSRVAAVVVAAGFLWLGAGLLGIDVVPFGASSASSVVAPIAPLNTVVVPPPTNVMGGYVTDQAAAIRLGKALFWDMQAGSDGKTACATCHFSAGTDSRTRNTLNPGKDANGMALTTPFAANTDLTQADFLLGLGDHVVGAQGVVPSTFGTIIPGFATENTTAPAEPDPVFTDASGQNEIQRISGSPGGTFSLTFDGVPTAATLTTGAIAADIQAALEALPNIGAGGVLVQGGPLAPDPTSTPVDITFNGPLVAQRNVPALTVQDPASPSTAVGCPVGGCLPLTVATTTPGGGTNLRRVTGRNTPSIINAVFNHRNFWDGRAQNHFNGVNPFGNRDNTAAVQKAIASAATATSLPTLAPVPPNDLNDASLASQAVGPPGNKVEMSADGRTLRDIGKKLLALQPLGAQVVDPTDSVLGPLVDPVDGKGLAPTNYRDLVKQAFNPRLWQSTSRTFLASNVNPGQVNPTLPATPVQPNDATLPADTYTQMQYNWPLFWGLAINLYEATLVSDQTPLDRHLAGDPNALTASQKAGFVVFESKPPAGGNCIGCHTGPELTSASVAGVGVATVAVDNRGNCNDTGFLNIGVRPTLSDIGNGGTTPGGNPLSETTKRLGPTPTPTCANPQVVGSFKTPGLRNVGLTAPYFHNGGKSTLEQVVAFYNAGGDFSDQPCLVFPTCRTNREIVPLGLTATQQTQLVDFLRNGLADPRVQKQSAPFDHPQIIVPNGHSRNLDGTVSLNPPITGQPVDNPLDIPATGAAGTPAPFATFLGLPGPVPNPPVPPAGQVTSALTPAAVKQIRFSATAARKLRLRALKLKGFVLAVGVPAGSVKIRIHLLKITKRGQLLVASFDKLLKGATGTVQIRIPARRLRRMTAGRYIIVTTRVDAANRSLETVRRRLLVVLK